VDRTVFKIGITLCAAAMIAACGAPQPRAPQSQSGEVAAPPTGSPVYRIDSSQSELRLLVYRAGPMAKFGHNHVMVNDAVSGWVAATDGVPGASLSLSIPVAAFVVDQPAARAAEGTDFSEEVADEAREGTRHNMLSEGCLDGERHPSITLTSRTLKMVDGRPVATLGVNVAGHESTLEVPFTLETSPGRLSVTGSFVLRQSDLGLVPFSILLGALQVQNEITVKFNLVAVKS
jgi:hypothetical protein